MYRVLLAAVLLCSAAYASDLYKDGVQATPMAASQLPFYSPQGSYPGITGIGANVEFGAGGPQLSAATVQQLQLAYDSTTDAVANGMRLLELVERAHSVMAQGGSDRVAVVLGSGRYDITTNTVFIAAAGIDIVSTVPGRQTRREDGFTAALESPTAGVTIIGDYTVINQLTDNVMLVGLNIETRNPDTAFAYNVSAPPGGDHPTTGNTVIMHCRFNSMVPGFDNYQGVYIDCVGGNGSWGGAIPSGD